MGYTVTGGAVGDRLSQTFSFINEAGYDFHLSSNDAGARNFGTDLRNDSYLPFSTDIDGNSRPNSLWDIGVDEAGATLKINGGVRINGGVKITN
jgi:hypothetical protein